MEIINETLRNLKQAVRNVFTDDVESEHYTPQPLLEQGPAPQFQHFGDLLPYMAWMPEQRLFLLEGQEPNKVDAIGFCLEFYPQTGASPDMPDMMSTLFQYMPPGTGGQWTIFADPLVNDFLDGYVGLRPDPEQFETQEEKDRASLYRQLAIKQAEFFRKGTMEPMPNTQSYMLRNFRIVMSVVVPETDFEDPEKLDAILALRESCITTAKTFYLFNKEWAPEDLINWCATILNPQQTILKGKAAHLNYDDGRVLKRQIVSPETVMRVTDAGLRYGLPQENDEINTVCMSVRSYPKACTLQTMGALIGDYMQPSIAYSSPFAITLGFMVGDFDQQRSATMMKAARATQKADSPMARFMPELIDVKRDWDIAQMAFDNGTGTIKIYHQLLLFAKPQDVPKAIQSAQAVWRSRQFEIVPDTYIQVQGLLASLPMALTPTFQRDLRITQRISTKTMTNAVNMAPLLAEWSGIGPPIIPMWGRRGQPMSIDLFSNTAGNYNGVVVGASGSGKSVLLNSIALSYLGTGARVWIFDIGRSFEKLCQTVGGQYIEFTPEKDIVLNPFSMIESIEEDLELLVPLFAQMISPNTPLDDYRMRQLGLHIQSVWYDYGQDATIDDLATSLINNCEKGGPNPGIADDEWRDKVRAMDYEDRQNICDPRIRDLGTQLFPFTSAGPYGRYFRGKTNVNFDSDFIVLEMEELAAKKDLQSVILFMLMYKITQEMYLTRDKRKLCILDEAWMLLGAGNATAAEFIQSGYRRARKYAGSFISATQSIGDYFLSAAATAALNNADWMFLLRQKPESVLAMEKADRLVMDEQMRDMLLSVKTHAGAYSEVFVHAGQMGHGIGRVMFDPFSLLLVSSKAEDFEAVKRYREMGYSTPQAIEAVLEERRKAKEKQAKKVTPYV